MKIFVVIPVHNRKDFTQDCLLSLRQQSKQVAQIIVVDDGSTDGTSEMIRQEFPGVVLLHGSGSLWWTGAINKGIRYALDTCDRDDHILVLNDDLVVPSNYVAALANVASDFPNALVGSVVSDIDNKDMILSGGITINWTTAKHTNRNVGRRLSSFPGGFHTEVSILTGRGVLIPSKVFREIGLYDDQHFLQCGDTELPVRAASAGYRLIVSYDVIVSSYPADKDHINGKTEYRLSDLAAYFGDIRSHSHLRTRFWFAYDTATSLPQGIVYFVSDVARLTYHFVRRLKLR
jgi:GT2 family glycosyltransferase